MRRESSIDFPSLRPSWRVLDIIVGSGGDRVIRAVKNATKTIPIVMLGSGTDPVVAA
jgi:predicted polyphosphate/ATP-dependent NAD kinase